MKKYTINSINMCKTAVIQVVTDLTKESAKASLEAAAIRKGIDPIALSSIIDNADKDFGISVFNVDLNKTTLAGSVGATDILRERWLQIQDGNSIEDDYDKHAADSLLNAAVALLINNATYWPSSLTELNSPFEKFSNLPLNKKLAIAGAFIAAEIDRINETFIGNDEQSDNV